MWCRQWVACWKSVHGVWEHGGSLGNWLVCPGWLPGVMLKWTFEGNVGVDQRDNQARLFKLKEQYVLRKLVRGAVDWWHMRRAGRERD